MGTIPQIDRAGCVIMTDWDFDDDEDFFDGLVEGAFWFGPWWITVLVIIFSLFMWWIHL